MPVDEGRDRAGDLRVGEQPLREACAPRRRTPRPGRSRWCAAWPRGWPSRRYAVEPVARRSARRRPGSAREVLGVRVQRRRPDRGRHGAPAGDLRAPTPAGSSDSTASRARTSSLRLVSCVDSVVIASGQAPLLAARTTSCSSSSVDAEVRRVAADLVQRRSAAASGRTRCPRRPWPSPGRRSAGTAPRTRPGAGRGRGRRGPARRPGRACRAGPRRAGSRATAAAASRIRRDGVGRRLVRARRRPGRPAPRPAARPAPRAGRGGCGRAARGASWQMAAATSTSRATSACRPCSTTNRFASSATTAKSPGSPVRPRVEVGQRPTPTPGRRGRRRSAAARRSRSCRRTASRPAAPRRPRGSSRRRSSAAGRARAAAAGSRAGRPGRRGGRCAGRATRPSATSASSTACVSAKTCSSSTRTPARVSMSKNRR